MTVTIEVQFQSITPLELMEPEHPIEQLADDPRLFELDNIGLAKGHVQVLKVLRYMTNVAEIEWPDDETPAKCSEIMARTISLREPVEGPMIASISESMRHAAVSMCFLPFKDDYPSPEYVFLHSQTAHTDYMTRLLVNTMIHKLRSSLETMLSLVPLNYPLLTWILSVRGIYSVVPERNWFIGHLVPVVREMGIRSWEDMRAHLMKGIWMQYLVKYLSENSGRTSRNRGKN